MFQDFTCLYVFIPIRINKVNKMKHLKLGIYKIINLVLIWKFACQCITLPMQHVWSVKYNLLNNVGCFFNSLFGTNNYSKTQSLSRKLVKAVQPMSHLRGTGKHEHVKLDLVRRLLQSRLLSIHLLCAQLHSVETTPKQSAPLEQHVRMLKTHCTDQMFGS